MAQGSWVTDDVDPLPRAFRLLASSLVASGEPAGKRMAARLRRDAAVLEGRCMTARESNAAHSRFLSSERRVRPVRNLARDVVARKAPKKPPRPMEYAELSTYVRLVMKGELPIEGIEDGQNGARIRAMLHNELVAEAATLAGNWCHWEPPLKDVASLFLPLLRARDPEAQRAWLARPRPSTPEWREEAERFLATAAPADDAREGGPEQP